MRNDGYIPQTLHLCYIMIKKINKIKDFGIYSDYRFAREHTPEFKKYNLIYGWNYSGKTTLSRIFRSFELKDFSSGFESSEFEN